MLAVTLVNPESLDTVADLRDALARTNRALMQAAQEIATTDGALSAALDRIARLAAHRHHGNTDAIMEILDGLLKEYFDSEKKPPRGH